MLSFPVAIGVGTAAAALSLLPLRGLPRDGEVAQGSRPPGEAAWHGVVGVLSIGLLYLGLQSRELLAGIEPFSSERWLLECTAALAVVLAVSPLLAILGTAPRRPGSGARATAQAVVRFALAAAPLLALEAAVIAAARDLRYPVLPQEALLDFDAQGWALRACLALRIVVASPIAEEAIFRGTIQPSLAAIVGPRPARIFTAVMFGIVHPELAMLPMMVLGYFFGRVRDASGRLVPCIVLHAVYNALTLVLFTQAPIVRDLFDPAAPR